MRCNWQRWLWGLIPLLMVSWVAIQVERDRIRSDLIGRANQALADSGSRWASVEANGRDIVLRGRASQDSEPPRAEQTIRSVWGVRDVENRAILPPKVEPFTWSARRRGNRIRLMGYVPDRSTRQAVIGLTKAAMPGLEVIDRMNTARGVPSPDTWLAGLSFALKQLSALKRGDARLEDLALTITGEAEDAAGFKAVNAAIKSGLPKGVKLASSQIAAPVVSPYTWSMQFAAAQLVLSGHVAGGEKARAELLAAAKAAVPGANVVDRMELAEGAPQGWAGAVTAVLKQLVRLENGAAETKDTAIVISGLAADEAQAQAVRAALRSSVPSSFSITDHLRIHEVKTPEPAPGVPAPPQPQRTEPAPRTESPSTAGTPLPGPPPPAEPAPKQQAVPAPPPAEPAPKQQAVPAPPPTEPAPKQQAVPAPPPAEPAFKQQAVPAPPPAEPAPKQQATPSPQAPTTTKQVEPAPPASPSAPPKVAAAPPPPSPSLSPEAAACQASLNSIARSGHINFATDSATLDSTSVETLDRLAAAAKACPGVRIAIEGHTDAEGSAGYNQRLSVRRARAVVAYLIKAGADRRQLEAVGYGLTRPAAPNDTEENMAKNRRIEFSVRQQ